MIYQIEKLRDEIIYLTYLFEKSKPYEARRIQNELNAAKQSLKAFKKENAPEMLSRPVQLFIKPLRMNDWTEEFETTLIK